MGNAKEENRRVKDSVGNAMLKLLRSQRLESISVTRIVETAGVSRMSFYRNFVDKTAVIEYCFERLMDEVIEELGGEPQLWSAEYGQVFFA